LTGTEYCPTTASMTASARLTSAARSSTAAATWEARSAVIAAMIACSRLEK
jgi:hypothetical protein